MGKKRILVLGASGMAGHVIYQWLSENGYDAFGLTRKKADIKNNILCDVKDTIKLSQIIAEGEFDYIINCVGILNKDAEDNKANAVMLNSYLPHFLAKEIESTRTKLIHMSTDCVFSGKHGNYTEDSFPDGETFYDRTKSIGEVCDARNLTFRNSIIGPDINIKGIGLFNWFMKQTDTINGYSGAIWSGVTTITLAKAMDAAIKQGLTGLYHLTNNTPINKFELLNIINRVFNKGCQINNITGINVNKSTINTRKDFSFTVPSYEDMIIEMKDWITSHKSLYPHY
jgi:dTDP-4-dehydrorhamnose reductase